MFIDERNAELRPNGRTLCGLVVVCKIEPAEWSIVDLHG